MAYLLWLTGPNRGQRELLDQPRTVIGRDPDCDIVLDSGSTGSGKELVISRKHAIVTQVNDYFFIEDGDGKGHESRNKTYVNGERAPAGIRVPLKNDDVIRICDFSFAFRDDDSSSIDAAISHDSNSYLAQPAEKLKLLLEITNRLSNTLELDVLLPHVVETLLQIFKQADRVFLILKDEVTGKLVPRNRKTRLPEQDTQAGFSSSIVKQCLDKVEGLLSNNPDEQFSSSASVAGLGLRSVMCAPLWSHRGKAFGVLLLDSMNDRRKFTEEDLALLMGVANQASIALANARFYRDALARERLNRDLVLAREVVRSFLPAEVPSIAGYEFFASNQSALEVGGDYYDFVPLPGARMAILVGDVAGKGIAAALVMTRFSAEARACLRTEPDLASAIRQLNDLMQPISRTDRFVTLVALLLDPRAHSISVVNAGHPSPLLLRRTTGILEEFASGSMVGPPIGVVEQYQYEERQATLDPGDVLVLFSDGVTDAMDVHDHQLGTAGLHSILQSSNAMPRALGESVLKAVKEHAAGRSQYDDITLVCLGRSRAAYDPRD